MHWETGTQTSVLAVDPVVSDKPTAAPLGGRRGALENTVSDGHSWQRCHELWCRSQTVLRSAVAVALV